MKRQILFFIASLIGLAETAVICIYLNLLYTWPIEGIIFVMAIGIGVLIFSSNLCNTFWKIETLLSGAVQTDLRLIAFRCVHDLFLLQSTVAVVSFLYLGVPKWVLLPLVKEALLITVRLHLNRA